MGNVKDFIAHEFLQRKTRCALNNYNFFLRRCFVKGFIFFFECCLISSVVFGWVLVLFLYFGFYVLFYFDVFCDDSSNYMKHIKSTSQLLQKKKKTLTMSGSKLSIAYSPFLS